MKSLIKKYKKYKEQNILIIPEIIQIFLWFFIPRKNHPIELNIVPITNELNIKPKDKKAPMLIL
jgi:hypothetical protein